MLVTSAAAATEGSLSKKFWNNWIKETVFASYSSFFVCLAAGNLELDVFRGFIAQDAFFHKAFVQAYEVAENFSDDDDDKAVIAELRDDIVNRQKTHKSIIEEWGVDHAKALTPNPTTVKFIELLQATAAGKVDGGKVPSKNVTPFEKTKIVAYLVSTITSYMRLHSFMIKQLHNCLQYEDGNHSYKKWIEDASSSAFEARTHENEELLDRVCISLTEEELKVVEKLYSQAMKLAIAFFNAQPAVVQETVVPCVRWLNPLKRHFVTCLDFDSTCNVIDSSAILVEIAIQTAKKTPQTDADLEDEKRPSLDLRSKWNNISELYNEEYEQCIRYILSTEKLEQGFNYESICNALEPLSDIKKEADSRVVESGILNGLCLDDIKRPGKSIILQNGCPDFLRKMSNEEDLNVDMHIFSDCWCGDLIRAAFSAGGLSMLKVHSNELVFKDSSSTGEIINKIQSSSDKLSVFKTILKDLSSDDSTDQQHLSVYIGDSISDLLCLLNSDIGIVIGTNRSLREVGTHLGVSFVPLFPELVKKQRQLISDFEETTPVWKGLSGVLYTVSSWMEIHAFIFGA